MNLSDLLAENYPESFGPEVVDGCNVVDIAREMVDLTVAHSPVIHRRDSLIASDVAELEGGRYRVFIADEQSSTLDVSADALKVMRARWLLWRGPILRSWHDLHARVQESLSREFFLGDMPWIPPKGSPLDRLARGETSNPLTIPRDGDAPVDVAALFTTLATPGAEVPAVCPTIPGGVTTGVFAVKAVPISAPEPPASAVLDGPHDKRCCFWKLNDPSGLDVTKLPAGLVLCAEHWERVRKAQGGAFRRFGPQREYVGDRYR